jgi:hypothetical protein
MVTNQEEALTLLRNIVSTLGEDSSPDEWNVATQSVIDSIDPSVILLFYVGASSSFEALTIEDDFLAGAVWELIESAADQLGL